MYAQHVMIGAILVNVGLPFLLCLNSMIESLDLL